MATATAINHALTYALNDALTNVLMTFQALLAYHTHGLEASNRVRLFSLRY